MCGDAMNLLCAKKTHNVSDNLYGLRWHDNILGQIYMQDKEPPTNNAGIEKATSVNKNILSINTPDMILSDLQNQLWL